MKETMGQIIRRLRRERGFTQEELAEHIGVTFQAVSKWENDTGMPDISQIVPLASVFEVSTDVLFGLADTTEDEEAQMCIRDRYEAASVLGFSKLQTRIHVVMPQMFKVVLPSVSNEAITLIKDTALVTSIGIADLLHYTCLLYTSRCV